MLNLGYGLVNEGAALAILDFDDPQIGIEAQLPFQIFGGRRFIHALA